MPNETKYRIFVAALSHGTNASSPIPTTLRSFEDGVLHLNSDLASLTKAGRLPGYGDALRLAMFRGDTAYSGPCAWAQTSGPCATKDYLFLRDAILSELAAALPIDFVFLSLHGSMMTVDVDDCEGDLLENVRSMVGDDVPIGVILDLHGNVTERMIETQSIFLACKEYPHTDYAERTSELYEILVSARNGSASPTTIKRTISTRLLSRTTEGPMRDFVERLKISEELPGILSVSAMHGFPWSEIRDKTASILVVYDGPQFARSAHELARRLAEQLSNLRETSPSCSLPIHMALDEAEAEISLGRRPVVIADHADNPGGGAACDSTFILRALLARQSQNIAIGMIWDPQAVAIATDAGVGAKISIRVGGKVGPHSGEPVDLVAEVINCRKDAQQTGLDGLSLYPIGAAVVIRANGVDIVLNSIRQQVLSPDCFTQLGIDLSTKELIVVKSTQLFRAAFDRIAAATIYCDASGPLYTSSVTFPAEKRSSQLSRATEETEAAPDTVVSFAFGPYRCIPSRRLLLRDNSPVKIGGRALDILVLLLLRAGEEVSKDALLTFAWPKVVVEESNLKVHVSSLRRALEDTHPQASYISTVVGHGYQFVGPLEVESLEISELPANN